MVNHKLTSFEIKELRDNVRRTVDALEVCWRCQNVAECHRHMLGNLVLVWLCNGCLLDMEQLRTQPPPRPKRPRKVMA